MNQNRTNVSAQKDTVVNYCWCLTHQVPLCPERQGPLSFVPDYPTSGGWFVDLAILLAAFPLRSFDFEEQNHYPKDAVFHPKSSEQYGQVREPPAKPGTKLNVPYHPLQL